MKFRSSGVQEYRQQCSLYDDSYKEHECNTIV